MGTLSQARTLGGVGSILMILFVVPSLGWILSLVGFVLVMVAIKNVSDAVGDRSIVNNMILSVVLAFVGLVVGVVLVLATVLRYVGLGSLTSGSFAPSTLPAGDFVSMIVGLLGGLAVIWVLLVVSAYFTRRSYDSIASGLGVGMFRTTALVYLIGAALTIVLVGFILIFIALILNIVAFFSLPDAPPSMVPVQPAPIQPSPVQP
jgi:uncharacterized membrane protein